MFGVSWGFAVVFAIAAPNLDGCSDCDKIAPVLWIPFAGPILAEFVDETPGVSPAFILNAAWSGAQIVGAFLLIKGNIGKKNLSSREGSLSLEPFHYRDDGYGLKLKYNFN